MKKGCILFIDLSGKVTNYDEALAEAIHKSSIDFSLVLALQKQSNRRYQGTQLPLFKFVPNRFKGNESRVKRIVKAAEGICNYILLLVYILCKKPMCVHFQWFPFMEFCSIDNYFVSLLKVLRPNQRIILTVHNVYPHDMSSERKEKYNRRFRRMDRHIEHYIVHVESSKREVEKEFGVSSERITAIPHGIFTPNYSPKRTESGKDFHIIVFGNNSPYKGSDLLLDALQMLPEQQKRKVKVTMAGKTSDAYLNELRQKATGLDVTFMPTFIPDEQLYKLIDDADYIALPYRNISQSGVLLLALYFRKPLIVSNLPSFVETLEGFSEDTFFRAGDVQSLKNLIERHLDGGIDIEKQMTAIGRLNKVYSWEESARKTIEVYEHGN